jgi:wyosine [tRNA(Phe)-imidazoG37] synthetase (radical SAM superfamily)
MALHESVVYGPIRSRRLGRSLGINLTPANQKICSFNCTYCQYGWSKQERESTGRSTDSWPSPAAVARAVRAAIAAMAAHGEGVDRLTLAGHGEPTLHPQFGGVVEALREMRDAVVPGVPIAVLSNASTLDRADVRDALARVDERYMKLDAGDANTLRTVNGSTLPLDDIVRRLSSLKDVTVQAMFVKDRAGRIDNTTELAVINWVMALQRIRPAAVHVYTIDRTPAWPYLQAASAARLLEIAQRVRLAGITCEVFTRPEKAADSGSTER